MKKFLLMVGLVMTSFTATAANNEIVTGALGFMIGGDDGWAVVSDDYTVDDCKVSYVQSVMGVNMLVEYDFNKANYASAVTRFENNLTWFSVSGDEGVQVLSAVTDDGKDRSGVLALLGLPPGASRTISFPMQVTQSRFANALADLRNQCPGKKSKY